jgi:hypothetical protein
MGRLTIAPRRGQWGPAPGVVTAVERVGAPRNDASPVKGQRPSWCVIEKFSISLQPFRQALYLIVLGAECRTLSQRAENDNPSAPMT